MSLIFSLHLTLFRTSIFGHILLKGQTCTTFQSFIQLLSLPLDCWIDARDFGRLKLSRGENWVFWSPSGFGNTDRRIFIMGSLTSMHMHSASSSILQIWIRGGSRRHG
ncbi:hypothetical protein DFH27DRAFT_154304 [Peziza echinospora]|nr:hypothetical protein DFH27DRAFT_154304 [Peziza echinospora]